jgi:hypothetical protein
MIFYTQLIFIKPGCEAAFHDFENQVLPLIKSHNGNLIYRIRPEKTSFVEHSKDLPYKIHLVSFEDKSDFESYAKDPKRLEAINLKN